MGCGSMEYGNCKLQLVPRSCPRWMTACLSLARPRALPPCVLEPSGIWLLGDFRRGQPLFGSWFVGLGWLPVTPLFGWISYFSLGFLFFDWCVFGSWFVGFWWLPVTLLFWWISHFWWISCLLFSPFQLYFFGGFPVSCFFGLGGFPISLFSLSFLFLWLVRFCSFHFLKIPLMSMKPKEGTPIRSRSRGRGALGLGGIEVSRDSRSVQPVFRRACVWFFFFSVLIFSS